MRILIALLALVPAVAEVLAAPARTSRPVDELRLVFLDGDGRAPVRQGSHDGATIEIGSVMARGCPAHGCMHTVVRRRFRVRVDGGASAPRFVRLRAFLHGEPSGQRVRVDGRMLTSVPQLIAPSIPRGVAIAHTLEIEVPVSDPPGALAQTLVWLVEDAR